jgi:hypothetical protein
MKRSELLEKTGIIFARLLEGVDENEIAEELNVNLEELERLKTSLINLKAEEERAKTPEEVYIRYLIDQQRNIRDLSRLIEDNRNVTAKGLSAVVGAIRARAEIHDKVIARGQEFGLVKKVPNRTESLHGIVIEDLTTKDLRSLIIKDLEGFGMMVNRFGEQNILSLPVPEQLHEGEGIDPRELEDDRDGVIDLKREEYTSKVKRKKKRKKKKKKMIRMKAHFSMEE